MGRIANLSPIILAVLLFIFFGVVIVLEFFLSQENLYYLYAESGLVELLQFGLLLISVFILGRFTTYKYNINHKWLKYFFGICLFSCFYITGEEISWGQSFFHWQTNAQWQEINNQNETNLHNTSRWLNQIPRYGLMLAIAVGGLILPLLDLFKIDIFPQRYKIIKPPNVLFITSLMLLVVALGNKMAKVFLDEKLFVRSSEIEELFIYLFIMLYLVLIKKDVKNVLQN